MGDFEDWTPQKPLYVDPATFDAMVRAERKRIRLARFWYEVKFWFALLGVIALTYFVLHYFKAC